MMPPQKQIDPASDGFHFAEMGHSHAALLGWLTPHRRRGEA
jgi:hypothetical protein